jgi:hypothetical protein
MLARDLVSQGTAERRANAVPKEETGFARRACATFPACSSTVVRALDHGMRDDAMRRNVLHGPLAGHAPSAPHACVLRVLRVLFVPFVLCARPARGQPLPCGAIGACCFAQFTVLFTLQLIAVPCSSAVAVHHSTDPGFPEETHRDVFRIGAPCPPQHCIAQRSSGRRRRACWFYLRRHGGPVHIGQTRR